MFDSLPAGFRILDLFSLSQRSLIIFLFVFIINLLLVSPELMPQFSAINPDDEAKYVDSGWRLLQGDVRDLAWGPIVALIYAPTHLIVGGSPDWFMIELWVGRFILFTFLWWSTLFLALQFKDHLSPFVMLGVLFVSTPFLVIVINQSDAVFVALSTLALANLIRFYQLGKMKYLGFSSFFIGMGVLARVEAIVLLFTLIILSIIVSVGKFKRYKILLAAILPALAIIGIYFISSLILTGKINLDIANKSYDSFEMNQVVLTGGDVELVRQETRRLFGTEEENQGSVIRAIFRNPSAFALRILDNAKTIPISYLEYFGKKLGPILLLFSAWGVYFLIRKRAWILLLIIFLWPLHALISLTFLALHIVPQVSYLPLLLATIGMSGIFNVDVRPIEKTAFLLINLLLLIFCLLTNKPAFMVSFLLLLFVFLLHWLINIGINFKQAGVQFSIFLLLVAGLILRAPFQFPNYPALGLSPSERAVHFLEMAFPSQTAVLVPSPLPAIASRMSYITMQAFPTSIYSLEDLWSFLKQEDVRAVYLDRNWRYRNDFYDLMEQGFEPYFTLLYDLGESSIRIFLVK
jgi:hypothetical protein